jgi:predicted phage tail protein
VSFVRDLQNITTQFSPVHRYAGNRTSDGEEQPMALIGLIITFAGFLVASASVGVMAGTGGRLVMVLVGILMSLGGIIGVITPAYRKSAVWKQ